MKDFLIVFPPIILATFLSTASAQNLPDPDLTPDRVTLAKRDADAVAADPPRCTGESVWGPRVIAPISASCMSYTDCPMQRGVAQEASSVSAQHMAFIERRLSELKVKLAITLPQEPKWALFSDTLRDAAIGIYSLDSEICDQRFMVWRDGLLAHEKELAIRLHLVQAAKRAGKPLYETLSPQQRRQADEFIDGPLTVIR